MTLAKKYSDKRINFGLAAFVLGCVIGAVIVIPVMLMDQGYFLYYGDFNVQQIPFYSLAHDSILSGNVKWSYLTDLGANFVGSYSFYLLTSPFFLITLLLPSGAVAYAFGPLLILKLGCASLCAYIYLRRYVFDKRFAVIGGILYAFSGFSIYNIFFFHFHEAIIIFPLLLAAVDEFMNTRRKGVVAVAVFAACVLNYYFFLGQVVFVAIYWFIKVISKAYRFDIKSFFNLAFECIIGVGMACVVLIPSVLAIIDNSRLSEFLTGYNGIVYSNSQRYMHILSSLFFPPDIPARANFTPDSNAKWSSVAAYLPLFSMTFVIGFMQMYKKSWLKRIMTVLFIMASVPILNSAFQAFNGCFYTRWFYMLTLMMALCTVISLENIRDYDYKRPLRWTIGITLCIALAIGFMVKEKYSVGDITIYGFGLEEDPVRFWIYAGIAVVSLAALSIILKLCKNNKNLFIRATAAALAVVVIAYSTVIVQLGKSEADEADYFTINYALNQGKDLHIDDVYDVRSDFYSAMDNIGMYWKIPNIQAFHSIVPGSVIDFYNCVGTERNVASRPEAEYYGLRGLLSVKYLFDTECDNVSFINEDGKTLMPGWTYIDTQNGFDVYENEHYVPMGFMYDKFICNEEFYNLSNDVKHLALMKAMVLSQDQMKKYADITGYTDGQYMSLNAQYVPDKPQRAVYPKYENYNSITTEFQYTQSDYYKDCEERRETSCSSFEYTKDGFKAQITNDGEDNLLFFSVPYDDGFTAYVNGEKAEIEKVSIGFMAVRIEGHKTSNIEFKYTTPGLFLGFIISCAAAFIFMIYLIVNKGFKAEKPYRRKYRIEKS